jgi:ribosome biogenesis GTPase
MSIGTEALRACGWTSAFSLPSSHPLGPNVLLGRIAAEHRSGYELFTEVGPLRASLAGRLRDAIESGGALKPAVGDWVAYLAAPEGGHALIAEVLPRQTALVRKAAGRVTQEQVVASNVDVVFLCASLGREVSVRWMERFLLFVWESGAQPVIVLTKRDLCDDVAAVLAEIEPATVGVPVHVVSVVDGSGLEALEPYFSEHHTVALIGASGAGKSTLLNHWLGAEMMATGDVDELGKGRHTTSGRALFVRREGGLVMDTPGMRELALWSDDGGVSGAFADVEALAAACRFADCTHLQEPGCAVLEAAASGELEADRLESYHKLQRELAHVQRQQSDVKRSQAKKQIKLALRAYQAEKKRRDRQ